MTQSGDPLENAIAERANGILKTEWLYKMSIATREESPHHYTLRYFLRPKIIFKVHYLLVLAVFVL